MNHQPGQKLKSLPFRRLQPPKIETAFHLLTSHTIASPFLAENSVHNLATTILQALTTKHLNILTKMIIASGTDPVPAIVKQLLAKKVSNDHRYDLNPRV
jgi:hypothetical protein